MEKEKNENIRRNPVTDADLKKDGYREQYGVIAICKDENEQIKIHKRLTGMGLKCKVVVT